MQWITPSPDHLAKHVFEEAAHPVAVSRLHQSTVNGRGKNRLDVDGDGGVVRSRQVDHIRENLIRDTAMAEEAVAVEIHQSVEPFAGLSCKKIIKG